MHCVREVTTGALFRGFDRTPLSYGPALGVHCKNKIALLTKIFVMWVAHLYPCPRFHSMYHTITTLPYHVATAHPKTAVM